MEGSKEYSAGTIAKWLLFRNKIMMDEASADSINNSKLQRFLYYAQGCVLALTGKPLFSDRIVAWEQGPAVPNIYNIYRPYGDNGIPYTYDYEIGMVDKQTTEILEQVYEVFAQYSAYGLSKKSKEETPWKTTERGKEISLEKIKQYFSENYVEREGEMQDEK